jgi:uncharacterized protein YueI
MVEVRLYIGQIRNRVVIFALEKKDCWLIEYFKENCKQK